MDFNRLGNSSSQFSDAQLQHMLAQSLLQNAANAAPQQAEAKPHNFLNNSTLDSVINQLAEVLEQAGLTEAGSDELHNLRDYSALENLLARLPDAVAQQVRVRLAEASVGHADLLTALLGDDRYGLGPESIAKMDDETLAQNMALLAKIIPQSADGKYYRGQFASLLGGLYTSVGGVEDGGDSVVDFLAALGRMSDRIDPAHVEPYLLMCRVAAQTGIKMQELYAEFETLQASAPDTFLANVQLALRVMGKPSALEDFRCISANLGLDRNQGLTAFEDLKAMEEDFVRQRGERSELYKVLAAEARSGTALGDLAVAYLEGSGLPVRRPLEDPRFERVLAIDRYEAPALVIDQGDRVALYSHLGLDLVSQGALVGGHYGGDRQRDARFGELVWSTLEAGDLPESDGYFDLSGLEPGVHHVMVRLVDQFGKVIAPSLRTVVVLPPAQATASLADAPPVSQAAAEPRPAAPGLVAKARALIARARAAQTAWVADRAQAATRSPDSRQNEDQVLWGDFARMDPGFSYGEAVSPADAAVWKQYIASLASALGKQNCGCGTRPKPAVDPVPVSELEGGSGASGGQAQPSPTQSPVSAPIQKLLHQLDPQSVPDSEDFPGPGTQSPAGESVSALLNARYYALLDQLVAEHQAQDELQAQVEAELGPGLGAELAAIRQTLAAQLGLGALA